MYSSEDFEKLWFLYKLEGQPQSVSIESFCLQQGVSYTAFYKWFSSRKKRIVPVEIVGMPASQPLAEADSSTLPFSGSVTVQSVMPIASVVISLSNGIQLSKNHLRYQELLQLVEKLEVLC